VKFRFDSAAVFALFAVAFAGVAHRLNGPTLYGGSPSVDLGQMSAWLASVAAVLMAVLKVLQQIQSFVEMLRKPVGPDAQPVYLGPAEPKVGQSKTFTRLDQDGDFTAEQIAAFNAAYQSQSARDYLKARPKTAEPPTKPEIPPGYVE
jgi:hypothetical protein